MKHKITLIISFYINLLTSIFPDSVLTMRFRGFLYSLIMRDCGSNLQVATGVIIRGTSNITIGDNVYIGPRCTFFIRKDCFIGNDVLVGPNCVFVDGNHGFDGSSYRYAQGAVEAIRIGDGSWITSNVVVSRGANIASRTIISPNSHVSKHS